MFTLVSSSAIKPYARVREIMNEALNKVESEWKTLETALSSTAYQPIQKIENCNKFGSRMAISSYEERSYERYGPSGKRSVEEIEKVTKDLAAQWLAEGEAIHTKNIPAIESNKKLAEAIKALMVSIGMPSAYRTSDFGRTGRARTKQYHDHSAGYLDDISREIKTSDGYDSMLADHKRFLSEIETYCQNRRAKEVGEQKKAAEELAKTEKARLLGVYQGRYGLPITATPRDILDHIIEKDKYLRLAHYLYLNRCSWVEGSNWAECGLNGFKLETSIDHDVYNDLSPRITEWDGDGRTFRDSPFGYDFCYAQVPPELYKQYQEILEWVGTDNLI